MTRVLLFILAFLEMAVGMFGLVAAVNLYFAHNAGMVMIFWPILAMIGLFLVAGAAIFVRRPWSYWLHMGVVLLIGLFFVLYVGPLFGPWGWIQALLIALVLVAPLTLIFLLAPVRRFFGVQAQ